MPSTNPQPPFGLHVRNRFSTSVRFRALVSATTLALVVSVTALGFSTPALADATPTATPSPTATPTPTLTSTATPTSSPTPSASPTSSPIAATLDATDATTSTISGHLTLGLSRNAPDVPAGDAEVTYQVLQGSSWSAVLGDAVVTTGGLYSITGLADGTYLLRFVYLGSGDYGSIYYGSTLDPNSASRVVIAGANKTINAGLPAPSSISGTVYLVNSARPAGAGDVTVTLVDNAPVTEAPETVATTTTDASGDYQFTDVPSDDYYEVVATPAHDNSYTTNSLSVFAYGGASYPGSNITLQRIYAVSGHISLGTSAVSAGNQVYVELRGVAGTPGASDYFAVQTDASGNYLFPSIESGEYVMTLSYSGSSDFASYVVPSIPSASCASACTFDPDDSTSASVTVDATLPPGNDISGTVTNTAGTPLGGMTVYIEQVDPTTGTQLGSWQATTISDGTYRVGKLPIGTFRVQFYGPAYQPQWWNNKSIYSTGDNIALSGGGTHGGVNAKLYKGSMIDGIVDIKGGTQADLDAGNVKFDIQYWSSATSTWTSIVGPGNFSTVLEYDDQPGIEHYVGEGQYSTAELDPTLTWRTRVIYQTSTRFGEVDSPSFTMTPGVTFHIRDTLSVGISNLAVGTLVKSVDPTQPRIYLVDGTSRLVPIDAFDSVSTMGLSTSFSVVDPTLISGRTVASASLGGIISCSGVDYVAGSGRLWPVEAGLVAAIPITTLDPTTCAVIPKSTQPFTYALFVKSASNPAIYYVDASGHKVAMSSFAQMNSLSAPDPANYIVVSDTFLNSLPLGPSIVLPGQLIKSSTDPAIYLVDGSSNLVPIASFDQASAMGVSTAWTSVTPTTISSRTISPGSLGSVISCSGIDYVGGSGALWPIAPSLVAALPIETLAPTTCAAIPKNGQTLSHALFVKSGSDPTIYYVDANGKKDAVHSFATIAQLSSPDPATYLVVAAGFVSALPTGPDLMPAGSLVKSASSPAIYLVDGAGGLIPVSSFNTITDMGLSTSYTVVSAASIAGVAASALTNLVSCAGQDYIAGSGKLWPISSGDAGSLPMSTLASSLCAVIPTSGSALSPALIRSVTTGAIYHLVGGKKVALTMATLTTLLAGAPLVYANMNDGYLASIPNG
jgi:hypothetical protein